LLGEKAFETIAMTRMPTTSRPRSAPILRGLFGSLLLGSIFFGLPEFRMPSALAGDTSALAQLAQLTVQKGFENISLGDVCDRLHIGTGCRAYQFNARIDQAESEKFGLPAGWQTALNVLPQRNGAANVVITDHDDHIGYGYLIGADEGLRAVTLGLSASGDGKNWRWRPVAINDETTQKFVLAKAYWLAQIKTIQALPDRKN
jgi:hypothetical protein